MGEGVVGESDENALLEEVDCGGICNQITKKIN